MSGCDFQNKSFSVYSGTGQQYRDNYDRIFGEKVDVGLGGPNPDCPHCNGNGSDCEGSRPSCPLCWPSPTEPR